MAPTSGEKGKAKQPGEASGSRPAKNRRKAKAIQNKLSFEPEDRWNAKEKERLLGALKIFAPTSIHSLSRFVRTKTPQEVEAKIASIREFPTQRHMSEKLEDEGSDKKAPLEAWLPVARDLVGQETADHSKRLSELIGIIGRTEVPRESFSSKLNWKNVYQYISDLLADRMHLQSLTSLESLVILDVIHNMADTLRNSDTEEQRRLLNLKYKYLMADPLCYPQFSNRDEMVAMALSNDFSSMETEATTSSSVASSSSSPSSSTLAMEGNDESRDAASSSSSSSSATQSNIAGSSSSTAPNTTKAPAESDVPSSSKTSNFRSSSGKATNIKESTAMKAKGHGKISFEDDDHSDQTASKVSPSDRAWTPENGYCRPRYYTLNPLCIPQHLLDFNLKKT